MWKLLHGIAEFILPSRTTSRLYLADRLAHCGVDVKRLPRACLQELADDIMRDTRSVAALSGKSRREIAQIHLDGAATNIARQLLGKPPLEPTPTEYLDYFSAIVRKHGVSVPMA